MDENAGNLKMNGSEHVIKIVLGLPILQPSMTTINSLLSLLQTNPFTGFSVSNCCLLPHSRNQIVRQVFKNCPDFDYILMADDDIAWDFRHVYYLIGKALKYNIDILSGLVLRRKAPYEILHEESENQDSKDNIVQCNFVSTSFVSLSRKVLEAVKEETDDGPIWFTMDRVKDKNIFNEVFGNQTDFTLEDMEQAFKIGCDAHKGQNLIGEDVEFCFKAKEHGFNSYVDYGCPLGHVGEQTILPEKHSEKVIGDKPNNSGLRLQYD